MILVMAYWEETADLQTIDTPDALGPQAIADRVMLAYSDCPQYPDYLFIFSNGDNHPILQNRYIRNKHFQG